MGESQGSPEDEPEAGERSSGTVVGAGASFAVVGAVILGPELKTSLPVGSGRVAILLVVLTVVRLLSMAPAFAVFLFASARSRSNIVSCATVATLALVSLRQATVPARKGRQKATNRKSTLIRLPTVYMLI